MRHQKNNTPRQRKLFFSLLFIFFLVGISIFFTIDKILATGQDTLNNCTTTYSNWSECSSSGFQERTKTTTCLGAMPYTSTERQTCTPAPTYFPCTDYKYSNWSTTCLNGYYTRSVISGLPTGCLATISGSATPDTRQACTATISTCSFTYSAWGPCQSDGTQSRTVLTHYPTDCNGGTPIIRQYCTASVTAPVCSFTYSVWGTCQANGTQTRIVTSTSPTGCTGGNPDTSRTCTYNSTASSTVTTQTQNSTTASTNVTPEFVFIYPNNDSVLRDKIVITGSVSDAKAVEFYLIPIGSNSPVYIGAGTSLENNNWEYVFDANQSPNGYFDLSAKITNAYGNYTSVSKVRVKIEHLSQLDQASNTQNLETAASQTDSSSPENYNSATPPEWQEKYFKNQLCLDKNYCSGEADPDRDGLNNNDEFRYRTNPLNPDSDGDGFLDGDEIKNGFNPLQFSPGDRSDKIVFESPKEIGEVKKDLYQVNNVEVVPAEAGKKELRLTGKALPNSFVNIYIYSDLPVILTVKTDSEGNWSYVLDKQIADGEHQVYVAVTDNTGKITAKSEPLFFVKTAEAATVIPSAAASALAKSAAPAEKRRTKDLMVLASIIILGFITALTAIGFYIVHVNKKTKGLV